MNVNVFNLTSRANIKRLLVQNKLCECKRGLNKCVYGMWIRKRDHDGFNCECCLPEMIGVLVEMIGNRDVE